ncbi:MAG: hypothetical protein GY814_02880 [Gammaproteobacteria bacterium]|nr:hypothetical protein [Gammaproteobacteria bacterium]
MATYDELLPFLTKNLIDEGKLLETGFEAFRKLIIPEDASQMQVDDMRLAYMAGAQHLWASILTVLDSGGEETPADLMRMGKIQAELDSWEQTLKLRFSTVEGGRQ